MDLIQFILGNSRVITQTALQTFQDEIGKAMNDPYQMVMRPTNLPVKILNEKAKVKINYSITNR